MNNRPVDATRRLIVCYLLLVILAFTAGLVARDHKFSCDDFSTEK